MKRHIVYLISLLILSGCMSSKRMLDNGYYDMAIQKSVKKLKKKPNNATEIQVLKESYRLANQKDNDKINFLRTEGRPDSWDEIFSYYSQLKNRQEQVRTLNQNILNNINYKYVNYDQEVINAKQKAAEYFYVHAQQLLKGQDKMSARQAFDELSNVKSYYSSYKDVDNLLNTAKSKGMSYVIFQMRNGTRIPLPPDFENELCKISLYELNSFWVNYDTREVKGREYDYAILVNMKQIDVSPEQQKEIQRNETKKIDDGFQYVLDSKGNVMKDSAGNDIKVKKQKEITCYVTEIKMHKEAVINATLDFINLNNNQLMKSDPINSKYLFDYSWVDIKGDKNAMSESTQKLFKNKPMPFPPDFDILLRAGQVLKDMTKDIIWSNKNYLK